MTNLEIPNGDTSPKGRFLDLHRHLPSTAFVLLVLLVIAAFGGAFLYAGVYNIGADESPTAIRRRRRLQHSFPRLIELVVLRIADGQ